MQTSSGSTTTLIVRTVSVGLLMVMAALALSGDVYTMRRKALVEEIANEVRETSAYLGKSALLDKVMDAIGTVPRHQFVPDRLHNEAYENHPLPIGHGQTISQPYIVALMTDLLQPHRGARILEIGTGSGYQAAVLAQLVAAVYSIEIIPELGASARQRLASLGYANVHVRIGDGYFGWPEVAPFDGILVTAAADHVPPSLLAQLKAGGRLIIPVGDRFTVQQLVVIHKLADGSIQSRNVLPVVFVPLTGPHAD